VLAPPQPYLEGVFPQARVVRSEKWTEGVLQRAAVHLLTHLPRREAVVRRKGAEPVGMRSLEVREPEVPAPAVAGFLQRSLQRVGRPSDQVDAELLARRRAIRGGPGRREPEAAQRKERKEAVPGGEKARAGAGPKPAGRRVPKESGEPLLPPVEEDNSLE